MNIPSYMFLKNQYLLYKEIRKKRNKYTKKMNELTEKMIDLQKEMTQMCRNDEKLAVCEVCTHYKDGKCTFSDKRKKSCQCNVELMPGEKTFTLNWDKLEEKWGEYAVI